MLTSKYRTDCIDLDSKEYPSLLAEIPDAPKKLYFKGVWNLQIFDKLLGIVGSRKISSYGELVISHIFETLTKQISTISGFTRGVDENAHLLSIEHNVTTIAVLPCGIETVYPSSHGKLYQNIIDSGGLVVSEFDGAELPRNWMFVKRNRIIAGLCKALLIIEAGEGSGSLVTYAYAKKYGRKILATPGNIFNVNQKGICHVLREGAKPVFSGSDINMEFGVLENTFDIKHDARATLDEKSAKILKFIGENTCNINQISIGTGKTISEVSVSLSNLQLKGLVKEVRGTFYAFKS